MQYLISILPIIFLFTLMLGFKMSGWKSALFTLIIAVLLVMIGGNCDILQPLIAADSPSELIAWASIEGILKAIFPIFLIILTAIFSYNLLIESGQIEIIKQQFISLTDDKGILVLLMVWGFGGLLEGMAGFGTAVAIPAAILIGLGFKPVFSAFVALLGNTVATSFGAIGVPLITLCKEASADGSPSVEMISEVSTFTILQLSPLFLLIPFAILMLTDKKDWIKNIILALWVGGVSFAAQFLSALYLGAETPAIIGSIAAILALIIAARLLKKTSSKPRNAKKISLPQALKAWSVYICILILILVSGSICPAVNNFLKSHLVTTLPLPLIGTTFRFGWISNAAFMILAGSIIGGLIQGITLKNQLSVLIKTAISLKFTAITIISLITLASVMNYSGMIATIALGLVKITGNLYPLFAPIIGAIGTFVTGSDTSSNILFAKLQVNVAHNLGLNPQGTDWLLASNTSGATGGKMLSPQSIAIATAACDIKGEDDRILKSAIPYALVYVLIAGLIVFCFLP